jgi:hypothetical protein
MSLEDQVEQLRGVLREEHRRVLELQAELAVARAELAAKDQAYLELAARVARKVYEESTGVTVILPEDPVARALLEQAFAPAPPRPALKVVHGGRCG